MTRDERFEVYFLKYKYLVMRLVMDMTGDYQTAQEICQEVFVSYYENMNRVLPGLEKAWLVKNTRNKAIDYLRRNKRKNEFVLDTPLCEIREVSGTLQEKSIAVCEDRMYHRELLGKILAEVREVNEQWYEILVLFCIEQCSYEEAAEKLGMSVIVLRARLHRARAYIRKHYGDEYEKS